VSPSDLHSISTVAIATCCSVVGAVWVLGAIYNFLRAPEEQDHLWLLWPSFLVFAVVAQVISRVPAHTWKPLLVHSSWLRLLGLGLLACSTLFTVWARLTLGTMWAGDPLIKVGHRLRTRGPYAVVRHPIYTGLLGMMAGAVMLAGGGRWFVFLAMNLVLVEVKVVFEERLLISTFAAEYRQYRARVPKLVPGLTWLASHTARLHRQDRSGEVPAGKVPGALT
jgi:protein-S-isoprenylcysteine O-methyltransferase Ste14